MSIAFAAGLPMVMAPANAMMSGPEVGWSGVTGGYNSGAGLSPLSDPYAGQGVGIYNDASAYRGGDFWGGGSDPFAGTIYAGGGGGSGSITGSPLPDLSLSNYTGGDQNTTPYDQYGPTWISYDINGSPTTMYGGIGSDAGATGGRYEAYDWMNQPDTSVPTPDPYSGGIGSDAGATRDRIAEVIASGGGGSLPAAGPFPGDIGSGPMSRPMPNLGYNPGMENWFANRGMNQFNPQPYENDMRRLLELIDKSTANQNLDINTGRSFYQGGGNAPPDTLNQQDMGYQWTHPGGG